MAASMRKEKVAIGEKFLNFLKILHENFVNLRNFCEKHKEPKSDGIVEFAERALEKLATLENVVQKLEQCKEKVEVDTLRNCIQSYAQILLDVTYCEETSLVDGIFPEKTSKARVHRLLCMLGQPELVCQHCFPDIPVKDMMGEEILECMLWRRGALLYMYCHTIHEQDDRRRREHSDFIWGCEHGALYLQRMLQIRQPLTESKEEVECQDDLTYMLLQKGIFSDTHILSLVYAGELCYWYLNYKNENLFLLSQNPNLSPPPSSESSALPATPRSPAELEKQEKIQARKKVEARRKNKKRTLALKDQVSSMEDLLLPSFLDDSPLAPDTPPKVDKETKPFDAWGIGVNMLRLYSDVAQGINGWSKDQALHLLQFFGLLQPPTNPPPPPPPAVPPTPSTAESSSALVQNSPEQQPPQV